MDLNLLIRGLKEVSGSPLAFVAYVIVAVAWAGLLFKESRLKNASKMLHLLSEDQRLELLLKLGLVPRNGLSAEQFLRYESRKYYFLGFGLVVLVALVLGTLALYRYIQLDRINVASESIRIAYQAFIRGTTTADDIRFKEAIGKLEESVLINPSYSTYQNLADVYEESGMVDKAIWASTKAAELDPANPSPRNMLGMLYKDKGDLAEAERQLKRAQKLFDDRHIKDDEFQTSLYVNLGNVYYELAEGAPAVDDKRAYARKALVDCYEPALQLRGAIKSMRFLANLLGNTANAHRTLGEYREAERLMFESIVLKEKIAKSSPPWKSLGISYFNLSDIYLKQGDVHAATKYLDLSEGIFTHSDYGVGLGSVELARATIAKQAGDTPGARAHAEKARTFFVTDNAALYTDKATKFLADLPN
jgi:tetratricopeptide (TPR) repeat protein